MMRRAAHWRIGSVFLLLATQAGCPAIDVWRAPPALPEEYERGLLVMYPGTSNLNIEMLGFYTAMKDAGLDIAIEVRPYGDFMEHVFDPFGSQPRFAERAVVEAQRLAEFIRSHPESPVTLLTFSGGAVFTLLVGAAMPDDAPLDRIIMMSPGVWKDYDVLPTLEHVTQGVVSYWSPREEGPKLIAQLFGTSDAHFSDPATSFGFTIQDPRLFQVSWTPDMQAFGNNGEHLDYFFNIDFIKQYVAPWVITQKAPPGSLYLDLP